MLDHIGSYSLPYSFELAEGLACHGVQVDLYINAAADLEGLPHTHRHRRLAVLGSPLFKHREQLAGNAPGTLQAVPRQNNRSAPKIRAKWFELLRARFLEFELAAHLRRRNYDLIWTHWPNFYCSGLWRICKHLGLKTAHTAHDVLPHDRFPEGSPRLIPFLRNVYGHCDLLFVHSQSSKQELVELFPDLSGRVMVYPHGIYTSYPRRPESREKLRQRLDLRNDDVAFLMCGAISPYKNVESVLAALSDGRCNSVTLIVAGKELGYADSSRADPLVHTRNVAQEMGVSTRVRFLPGYLPMAELAELLEAVDALVLPYRKSYGSGLLLLGMTFGKHIVTTVTGGAEEYLAKYAHNTRLEGVEPAHIAAGLAAAAESLRSGANASPQDISHLQWPVIGGNLVAIINSRLR